MTNTQVNYAKHREDVKHNRRMEELQNEANINSREAARLAAQTNLKVAAMSKAANKYSADMHLAGTKYSADSSRMASAYATDSNYSAAMRNLSATVAMNIAKLRQTDELSKRELEGLNYRQRLQLEQNQLFKTVDTKLQRDKLALEKATYALQKAKTDQEVLEARSRIENIHTNMQIAVKDYELRAREQDNREALSKSQQWANYLRGVESMVKAGDSISKMIIDAVTGVLAKKSK